MKTLLVGKLNDNVKLFHLKNGNLVGKFHILFKDSNEQYFISCRTYNNLAKRLAEVDKGQSVDLVGNYCTSTKDVLHTYFIAKALLSSIAKKENQL